VHSLLVFSDRFSHHPGSSKHVLATHCARALEKNSRSFAMSTHTQNIVEKKDKFCVLQPKKLDGTVISFFFSAPTNVLRLSSSSHSLSRECHLSLLVFRQFTMGALCLFNDKFSTAFFSQRIAQNEKCFSSSNVRPMKLM
jgi:hypothetical protein